MDELKEAEEVKNSPIPEAVLQQQHAEYAAESNRGEPSEESFNFLPDEEREPASPEQKLINTTTSNGAQNQSPQKKAPVKKQSAEEEVAKFPGPMAHLRPEKAVD